MMKTLAETGNGWMTFKDTCNARANQTGKPGRTVHSSNLCTEIVEITSDAETAVCNLGSINLAKYINGDRFDFDKLRPTCASRSSISTGSSISIFIPPLRRRRRTNAGGRWAWASWACKMSFFSCACPSTRRRRGELSKKIQEEIYFHALSASCDLAASLGRHADFDETRMAGGAFQFDLWGVTPENRQRWDDLRQRIAVNGLRNSLLIAIAPTATIGSIVGSYESIEPAVSNLFKRETLSGEFLQINRYLATELKSLGLWTDEIRAKIKLAEGSIQDIEEIPAEIRAIYRTAWEIPMRSLIDMAADRGAFIDQSQSLNLFMESPSISKLSSMYMYAWKKGLKTTYYLRSRPATRIAKATVAAVPDEATAVACSLENPESCEACQ